MQMDNVRITVIFRSINYFLRARFKDLKEEYFFLYIRKSCHYKSDNRCRHSSSHTQDYSDINDTLRRNYLCYNVVTIKSSYDRRTSMTEDSETRHS